MPELTAAEALEVIRTGLQVDTPEPQRLSLPRGGSVSQYDFAKRLMISVEVAHPRAINILVGINARPAREAIYSVRNKEWLDMQRDKVAQMQRHLARVCVGAFATNLLPGPRQMNIWQLGLLFTAECLANRGILLGVHNRFDPTLQMAPAETNTFMETGIGLGLSFRATRTVIANNKRRKSKINAELQRLSGRGNADSTPD